MRPAQERFERDDLARREQKARLIVEFQLIILQRLAQLLLPVEARERCQAQRIGIESDGAMVAQTPRPSMRSSLRSPVGPGSTTGARSPRARAA